MRSKCYSEYGHFPGTDTACLAKAWTVYKSLQGLGGVMSYDKTPAICPNVTVDGISQPDPSMKNDYSHGGCNENGSKCGYENVIGTGDTSDCLKCCDTSKPPVKDSGNLYDDLYCACLPANIKCGTTNFASSFNNCDQCCSGAHRVDDGWYDDFYCL